MNSGQRATSQYGAASLDDPADLAWPKGARESSDQAGESLANAIHPPASVAAHPDATQIAAFIPGASPPLLTLLRFGPRVDRGD